MFCVRSALRIYAAHFLYFQAMSLFCTLRTRNQISKACSRASVWLCGTMVMCLMLHSNQGLFWNLQSNMAKPVYNWNCPDVPRNTLCTMPKRFVINGRPSLAYAESWNFDGNPTEPLKTMDYLSNVRRHGACTRTTWESDLFQIYQQVFDDVLQRFSDRQGFLPKH